VTPPAPSVFIAHPLSAAKNLPATERLVRLFRDAFLDRGWTVRPRRGESVDALNARVRAGLGTSLVASNVEGIVASDLLLVIATEMDEPSSVWVEAGVAIARAIPLVVVADPSVRLPFLVGAVVAPGAYATGGPLNHLLPASSVPALATGSHKLQAVEDLVDSIIAGQ
jgi:hypothetical protein